MCTHVNSPTLLAGSKLIYNFKNCLAVLRHSHNIILYSNVNVNELCTIADNELDEYQ